MTDHHPVLGIDYGDARIGVAITDSIGIMAHPLETITRKGTDPICRIIELIEQRQVKQVVIGLPLKLDGGESESSGKARRFASDLREAMHEPLPVHLADERFTTVVAAEKLHAAGKNARKQKSMIDQAAAVEILSDWLRSQTGELGEFF